MHEETPCARRAIELQSKGNRVTAWLEDDFHHFGIDLHHDGAAITEVAAQTLRFPRDTCPGAVGILADLAGTPLHPRSTALGLHTNMRLHCTHLYDLLGLAMAQAATGRDHRRYDVVVPDRQARLLMDEEGGVMAGSTQPSLYRDGELVMVWDVEGNAITGPEPYTGISMGRGFREWTETLNIELAEAAHVLRRATMVALGRLIDMDDVPVQGNPVTAGLCYSYQPDVALHSQHTTDKRRDYSDNPEGLLADIITSDQRW